MTPLLLLAMFEASAHPMSRERYSLRAALRLSPERLDALVVLEVPFAAVMADLRRAAEAEGVTLESREARGVLDRYNATVWRHLSDALILTANGRPLPGAWVASESRLNGKGAVTEGFFMYLVEFRSAGPLPPDASLELALFDAGWPDVPMTYSAFVEGTGGWTVAQSSTTGVLPSRPYDLNDPSFWADDPSLRVLVARFVRAP